jgi:hypothetical protein
MTPLRKRPPYLNEEDLPHERLSHELETVDRSLCRQEETLQAKWDKAKDGNDGQLLREQQATAERRSTHHELTEELAELDEEDVGKRGRLFQKILTFKDRCFRAEGQ